MMGMMGMIKKYSLRLLLLCAFACNTIYTSAQNSTDIIENNSTHIGRITKDSIIVITGSTYSFTVDTPEDKGLVSTTPTIQQLLQQVTSKDGSIQTYRITDKDGVTKNAGD